MEVFALKIIIDKYSKFLFKILLIVLVLSIVYFLIPKYQLINHSGSIYKLNRLTGQVTREYTPSKTPAGFGIKKPAILLRP
ncbi:hypothetical protein ES705_26303 [subsurface metagenome]